MCDCLEGYYCECFDVPGCDGICADAMLIKAGGKIPTEAEVQAAVDTVERELADLERTTRRIP
jgi:hypothetical protein